MKLLIVEDSRTLSKVLKHLIIQEIECEVDIAPDLASAIHLLEHNKYFLVVADLNLPDAPNGEIVSLVLNSYHTTCIVLTASLDSQQRKELLKLGIADYVLKENRYSYEYVVKLISRLKRNQQVKVLVADDSVVSRKFVRVLLEQHLFQVLEAHDGAQALTVLKEQPDIQLLITDYNMPNVDGFELILRVREKFSRENLAIIGLSNDNDESLSARFIKNGANDFLQKPFVHEEFHCRVRNTLDSLDMIRSLWETANRDYLTQSFTRRYFFKKHQYEQQENNVFSVALIDIDFFKKVNDSHGHDVGDQVLIEFAKRLETAFGQLFTVARFGGEEFVVAFKGLDGDKTHTLMDKFRQQCANKVIDTSIGPITMTFSCGVATLRSETIDSVLHRADEYLYLAKDAGRNQVVSTR
ncbi:response regulator [Shewanella glacialimarina]|uniref:response regulator n=1 Tax=Shewanella glacialimarina TaxID=2590884 RepID=UPI001CF8AAAF|nr:response regulator [Shewanella glacialimarina]UCX04313.1 response regulator [Shewanella glacialimarina]